MGLALNLIVVFHLKLRMTCIYSCVYMKLSGNLIYYASNCKGQLMTIFNMLGETEWEKARAATLWTKEPETIEWIKRFEGGIFWDIGANIGIYSLYCAYRHPDMEIHAFEPMKGNFLRLWQNILLNDFVNITAHFKAFGADRKIVKFEPGNKDIGSSGGQVGDSGYPIEMIDGHICYDCSDSPKYIKIDTDGNEYDILSGMSYLLKNKKLKGLLVEVNNHEEQVESMMADAGLVVDDELMALKGRPKHDHNVIYKRK